MAKEKKELVDKLSVNAADRSPLLRAQKETYLETQAKADKYNNMGQYMFWGATSLMFGIITTGLSMVGGATGSSLTATVLGSVQIGGLALSAPLIFGVAAAAAVGLALGNVYYSSKGREASEKANVLYSDIDSQQQSHRMVQAFAKAQSQGQVHEANNPYAGTPGTSWAQRVGSGHATAQGTWADKIAAEALAEEAAVLEGASR